MSTSANATKLYKWVDKNGQIYYQDSPPPRGSKILEESEIKQTKVRQSNKEKDTIVVYTAPNCELCEQMMAHLREMDIPTKDIRLQTDREAQSLILEKSDSLTVPSIFIGNELFQGNDFELLDTLLERNGYSVEKAQVPDQQSSSEPQADS